MTLPEPRTDTDVFLAAIHDELVAVRSLLSAPAREVTGAGIPLQEPGVGGLRRRPPPAEEPATPKLPKPPRAPKAGTAPD